MLSKHFVKIIKIHCNFLTKPYCTLPLKGVKQNDSSKVLHRPVMLNEVLNILNPKPNQNILDMTFGAGGHTREILKKCPGVNMFTLDRDPLAFELATQLSKENPRIKPMLGKFSEVKQLLAELYGVNSIDGVILDAGVSSMQFDVAERGFAISKDGPLDMRMDQDRDKEQLTAYDVVNYMSEANLLNIIKKYGEDSHSVQIARSIVDYRHSRGYIKRTHELAKVVAHAFSDEYYREDKIDRSAHLATKTFQAIRIFVNNELNQLASAMDNMCKLLSPGGVCVVLTFHSLEDRIVKRHFHGIDMNKDPNQRLGDHHRDSKKILDREVVEQYLKKMWRVDSRKSAFPTHEEVEDNPRARSAKLRYAYKPEPEIK